MTRMSKEEFSRQWEIARRICNYKVAGVLKPTVTGGAAIDTYLKRKCKDFDTYIPESLVPHFDVQDFCTKIGIETRSSESQVQILNSTKEYGECTLQYVIKGELLGAPVHIEIISWKPANERQRELYSSAYIREFYNSNLTDDAFVRAVTSTFSVNTSMLSFYGTTCNNLVLNVPHRMVSGVAGISNVVVYDLTSKLMDKSLEKYDKYAASPPFFYEPALEGLARSEKAALLSSLFSYTNLNGAFIRIRSYPLAYNDGVLEHEVQESYRRTDKAVSLDLTTWGVSDMREGNPTRAGGLRPLPPNWARQVRTPQELQPARIQGAGINQAIWNNANLVPATAWEFRGRVGGGLQPAPSAPGSPHWV